MAFLYCVKIPVTASADGAQNDYQMKLTIVKGTGSNTAGTIYLNNHSSNWPYDIQFKNASGTVLDYWREEYDATDMTVWVKCDSIAASGETDFYLYYGDSGASDASNGDDTFLFFDHFDAASLDTNKWYRWNSNGTISISNSIAAFTGHASYLALGSKTKISYKSAFRGRVKINNDTPASGIDVCVFGADERSSSGSASGGIDNALMQLWGTQRQYLTTRNGTQTISARTTSYSDNYIISEIQWLTASIAFYENNTLVKTHTTNLPTDDLGIIVYARDSSRTVYWDWVLMRKLATNEPSWAAPGNETYSLYPEGFLFFPNKYRSTDDLPFLPST